MTRCCILGQSWLTQGTRAHGTHDCECDSSDMKQLKKTIITYQGKVQSTEPGINRINRIISRITRITYDTTLARRHPHSQVTREEYD